MNANVELNRFTYHLSVIHSAAAVISVVRRLQCYMTKPLVTFVKFLAPFPRVRGRSDDAVGRDLVHQLAERLAYSEIKVHAVKHTGNWNWRILARNGKLNISTTVGIVDDFIPGPVNQWLAMHYSNLRFPWKLLPNSISRKMHIEGHERYCKPFCEIVEATEGLGSVTWYNTTSMGIRIPNENTD